MDTYDPTTKDWRAALAALITRTETPADRVLLASLRQRLSTPDLLDKKQAADFLTIKPRTLDDWRAAKLIPVIHRGGFVRFRREDLETFLATHTMEARKESPYRPRRRKAAPTLTSTTNP